MKIVHILQWSPAFSRGYIEFMQKRMTGHTHIFFVPVSSEATGLGQNDSVRHIYSVKTVFDKENIQILRECDKIIVSGLFFNFSPLVFFPKSFMRKMYVQLWGGELYLPVKKSKNTVQPHGARRIKYFLINVFCKISCYSIFQRCKAIITLIQEDYPEFERLWGLKKMHFEAPMPSCRQYTKEQYPEEAIKKTASPIVIQIGHSATRENYHCEILDALERFKAEDIRLLCPLSYGDKEYADSVIKHGRALFGEKFYPLTDLLPLDEYQSLLSTARVAIFNIDMQQAMGNISMNLRLKTKVYLRDSTSMWKCYTRRGYKIFNIADIHEESFASFINFPPEDSHTNYETFFQFAAQDTSKKLWEDVLNS